MFFFCFSTFYCHRFTNFKSIMVFFTNYIKTPFGHNSACCIIRNQAQNAVNKNRFHIKSNVYWQYQRKPFSPFIIFGIGRTVMNVMSHLGHTLIDTLTPLGPTNIHKHTVTVRARRAIKALVGLFFSPVSLHSLIRQNIYSGHFRGNSNHFSRCSKKTYSAL